MTVETPIEMLHLPEQLRSLFAGKLPEAATSTPEERKRNFLSRVLAAYAIQKLGWADLDQAATAIVDGGGVGKERIETTSCKGVFWLHHLPNEASMFWLKKVMK